MITSDISNHQHSCRHDPSGHWSYTARFFLDNLILSNFNTTVIYRVINIKDLDSVTPFLCIRLHAVSSWAGLCGAVAVSTHTGAAPGHMTTDTTTNKLRCWGNAGGSAPTAAVLIAWGQETSRLTVATVMIR